MGGRVLVCVAGRRTLTRRSHGVCRWAGFCSGARLPCRLPFPGTRVTLPVTHPKACRRRPAASRASPWRPVQAPSLLVIRLRSTRSLRWRWRRSSRSPVVAHRSTPWLRRSTCRGQRRLRGSARRCRRLPRSASSRAWRPAPPRVARRATSPRRPGSDRHRSALTSTRFAPTSRSCPSGSTGTSSCGSTTRRRPRSRGRSSIG